MKTITTASLAFVVALTGCAAPHPPIDENSEPIVNIGVRSLTMFERDLASCQKSAGAFKERTGAQPPGATVVGVNYNVTYQRLVKSCLKNALYDVTN